MIFDLYPDRDYILVENRTPKNNYYLVEVKYLIATRLILSGGHCATNRVGGMGLIPIPSSHTTVRAVRHTAVRLTYLFRDGSPFAVAGCCSATLNIYSWLPAYLQSSSSSLYEDFMLSTTTLNLAILEPFNVQPFLRFIEVL